ncbi:MAG TPA: fumarate reductase subunit FrdD [Steroidobacteraceae bacterium]|nr:fumarate reductase subunit FrdD [Steroidobacteraceae bacterium]
MKRSNKPIFWSLFGAGGMLSALVGPVLVFVTGIAVPLGLLLPRETMSYERMLAFVQGGFGKLGALAVISLFLFHGLHRMYHVLHDVGIHVGAGLKALFHGFAIAGTLACIYLLAVVGR